MSSSPRAARTSAPGKLILAGEHAAVYGFPALAAAVGLRVRTVARVAPPPEAGGERGVRLELADLGIEQRVPWSEIDRTTRSARAEWSHSMADPKSFRPRFRDAAGLARIALGEARAHRPGAGDPELLVRVSSELPPGSGFGSSAAVAATLAAATLSLLDRERATVPSREEIEAVVGEVERRQHGRPSGVDAAIVLRGGVSWAKRHEDALILEPLDELAGSRSLRRFQLLYSGAPGESTGEVVAHVRARYDAEPAAVRAELERLGAAAVKLRSALEHEQSENVLAAVRACERGLEALGVVPEPIRTLVRAIERAGGAAKISGAGSLRGPGAGVLLVYHPTALERAALELPPNARWIDAELGAPGLEIAQPDE